MVMVMAVLMVAVVGDYENDDDTLQKSKTGRMSIDWQQKVELDDSDDDGDVGDVDVEHLFEVEHLKEGEQIESDEKSGRDDPVDGEVGAQEVELDVDRVETEGGGLAIVIIVVVHVCLQFNSLHLSTVLWW